MSERGSHIKAADYTQSGERDIMWSRVVQGEIKGMGKPATRGSWVQSGEIGGGVTCRVSKSKRGLPRITHTPRWCITLKGSRPKVQHILPQLSIAPAATTTAADRASGVHCPQQTGHSAAARGTGAVCRIESGPKASAVRASPLSLYA